MDAYCYSERQRSRNKIELSLFRTDRQNKKYIFMGMQYNELKWMVHTVDLTCGSNNRQLETLKLWWNCYTLLIKFDLNVINIKRTGIKGNEYLNAEPLRNWERSQWFFESMLLYNCTISKCNFLVRKSRTICLRFDYDDPRLKYNTYKQFHVLVCHSSSCDTVVLWCLHEPSIFVIFWY